MIPAVHPRGTNVGGLLRYLFGPGKREEHVNPRLVAAWDGAGPFTQLEPPARGDGRRDLRRLTELLEQPVVSGWNPPAKTVWHCSIRNHPTDRYLTDDQWAHIAGEVMAAVGLTPHGDPAAVRWVAVRHSNDHVHLVATLVRQDRRTAWAWKDKLHAQQACRDLEERYGLYRVAPPGAGSRTWPRPSELNKAARLGRTDRRGRPHASRDRLRREVRAAATAATDEVDFFGRLRHAGIQVRLRYSPRNPDQMTGYAVAMAGHTTHAGEPIWYGGGRLAADLTLPRLRTRWTGAPQQPAPPSPARLAGLAFPPRGLYRRAVEAIDRATAAMSSSADPRVAAAIGAAAADLLTATANAWERGRGGLLTDAAELFDRAAHELQRHQGPARRVTQAMQLRSMARLVTLMGVISGDEDTAAALRLVYTLAAFAEHLADIRETQQCLHQAQAARTAAAMLRTHVHPKADAARPPSPGAAPPGAQRESITRRDSEQRSR